MKQAPAWLQHGGVNCKVFCKTLNLFVPCCQDSAVGKRNAPKVLIFANRIKTVRFVQQSLVEAGFKAAQLHGDRSQPEREVPFLQLPVALCKV